VPWLEKTICPRDAIKYNLELGYRLCEGQEDVEHQRYEMTWDSFTQSAAKIRKMVRSISGNNIRINILFEPEDYKTGIANRFEELFIQQKIPHLREETTEGIWYRALDDKI